ncbi:histidine phosphatase family protein [Pirellulaceae bacterium SH501]
MHIGISRTAASEIILIRHAEVDSAWKRICYGNLDVPLSQRGIADSRAFAESINDLLHETASATSTAVPILVFHSGLARTASLAEAIVCSIGVDKVESRSALADDRLMERNYGRWQGESWDSAYNSDPENFHDLIDQPDTYRPPKGETTTEMQRRIVSWYEDMENRLPVCRIIAVSHSGPIAALVGYLLQLPANQWNPWIIGNLESIIVGHSEIQRLTKEFLVVESSRLDFW